MERLRLDFWPDEAKRRCRPSAPAVTWPIASLGNDRDAAALDAAIDRLLLAIWTSPDEDGIRHPRPDADLFIEPSIRWLANDLEAAVIEHEIGVTFGGTAILLETGELYPLSEAFVPRSARAAVLLTWRRAVQRKKPLRACAFCGCLFAFGSRPAPIFCSPEHAVSANAPGAERRKAKAAAAMKRGRTKRGA